MNHALIELLRARPGRWCRPREIAEQLGHNLADLEMEISTLRAEGYHIEFRPVLGYRLESIEDRLIPYEISRSLGTAIIGSAIECHSRVGSTNDVAWAHALKGAPEGLVVLAEEQTSGRGRFGRTWEAPPRSGLLMSILLRPKLQVDESPLLTLTSSVAVAEGIAEHLRLPVMIRWPNDVTIRQRKVAGILVESRALVREGAPFVVGIGVNVNGTADQFSPQTRQTATTLSEHAYKHIDRNELARVLIRALDRWYLTLLEGNRAAIAAQWRRMTSTIGRHVSIVENGMEYHGHVLDISLEHGLIVRLDNSGVVRQFNSAHVSICREE